MIYNMIKKHRNIQMNYIYTIHTCDFSQSTHMITSYLTVSKSNIYIAQNSRRMKWKISQNTYNKIMSRKMNKNTSDYYHHFIAKNTNLYHYRHTRVIIDIITVNTHKSVQRGFVSLYRISVGYSQSLDSRKTKGKKKNKKQNKTNKQTKTYSHNNIWTCWISVSSACEIMTADGFIQHNSVHCAARRNVLGTAIWHSAPLTSTEISANSVNICVMCWSVINLPQEGDIRCGIWTLSILTFSGIFLVQVSSATWAQDVGESLWKIRLGWFGNWQYWGLWNLLIISMVRSILTYALKWVCSFLLSRGYSLFRKFGNFNLISLSK